MVSLGQNIFQIVEALILSLGKKAVSRELKQNFVFKGIIPSTGTTFSISENTYF